MVAKHDEDGRLFNFFKDSLQHLVYIDNKEQIAKNMFIGMFHHKTLEKYKRRVIDSLYNLAGICRVFLQQILWEWALTF